MMDNALWIVIGIVVVFLVIGFVFKTFLKIGLVLAAAALIFTLFFGDGAKIVQSLSSFMPGENEQIATEFYEDFKSRSQGPVDAENMLQSIKDWVAGKVDIAKVGEDLFGFADENLTLENLNLALDLISEAIESKSIPEELTQFAQDQFSAEKAEEFLLLIQSYINE